MCSCVFVSVILAHFACEVDQISASASISKRMSDQPYQPLLADRSKLSMIYGVNEYEEMLRQKMSQNSEIAQLKVMSPDQQGPSASAADGMLKSSTEADGKSKKGKREFPTPNKPDPMPRELEFLFTRISPEQMLYKKEKAWADKCVGTVKWTWKEWAAIRKLCYVWLCYFAVQIVPLQAHPPRH